MTTQSADHLYSKSNPYSSGLLVNRVMTEGSDKETRHFEFSLQDSGLSYEPGDSLGVLPVNCSEVVDDLLSVLGFSGTEPVQIGEESFSLKDTLLHKFACTVLSKIQIKKFNDIARVPALEELLKIENKNDLVDYMWGRELIDLFKEYPQQGLAVEDFVSLLRPMPPRLYSIASSLSAHSEEVHLTVAVVRYDSHGRKRKGVCSSYLAERVGETIPCYFHPNKNFKLPAVQNAPIIMVGPGTGIAPFRAFIEERMATGATGKNWLFFGDRSQKTDYLYGEEWIRYQKEGILNELDLAWSRDQEEKVYVQHKMLERGAELWNWIQEGALFYVCGDASRMAKDVDQALRTIAQEHGSMSEEDSAVWIKSLQKEKRYLKDVY
ncbi:diflavin oxidoreductase [Candidatus Seribacter sulfatis]|uniref:diflavin oxidoreductase n=1 Tax=Candidatus Seribacter sulfatis TaxID=3381756 RepID=UPI0031BF77AD|nr:sulfite reductase subunit alpha [Opitutales bacterium]